MLGCLRTQKYLLVPKHNHFTSFYYLTYPLSHHYPDEKQCLDVQFSVEDVMPPAALFAQLSRGFLAKGRSAALATSSGLTRIERSSPWRIAHTFHPLGSPWSNPSISIHALLGSSNWGGIIQLDWCVKSQKSTVGGAICPNRTVLSWRTASCSRRWSLGLCERGPSKRPQLQRTSQNRKFGWECRCSSTSIMELNGFWSKAWYTFLFTSK